MHLLYNCTIGVCAHTVMFVYYMCMIVNGRCVYNTIHVCMILDEKFNAGLIACNAVLNTTQ